MNISIHIKSIKIKSKVFEKKNFNKLSQICVLTFINGTEVSCN